MNFNHAKSLLAKALLITLLSILFACGGGGGGGAVGASAAISSQPTDQSVVVGSTAGFTVVATDATGYQWQSSTDGGTTFANVSGATATSHTTAPTILTDDGTRYRVVVSDASNSVTSSAVTLTVTAAAVAPSISVQPADQTITEGQNASFSITAAGTSLSYQWQRSTNGGASFTDVAGETGATLTLTAVPLANDTHQFRVVVSNNVGSVTSNAATLNVNSDQVGPPFITQPASQSVIAPDTATFNVVATGSPMPTLQWQLSTDGGSTFADIASATGSSYTTAATGAGDNGNQYRVIATNTAGTIDSNAATLTVTVPSIPSFTTQPADVTITEGQNAQFTVAVTGTPTPTLQWQLSTDSGSNWSNVNGATSTALDFTGVALANNGRQFRAVASNSEGTVASNAATLTVTVSTGFPAGAMAFSANDGVAGSELWITDGASAGTVMVKDINPGPGDSLPQFMSHLGGIVLFMADDGVHGNELWRSDGTAAGTFMVSDLRTGSIGSFPAKFTLCNGSLFFGAQDGLGAALWKTDGTAGGTTRLAPITVMNTSHPMVCVNNMLILSAFDDVHGMELWRSDGTVDGTVLVLDIVPGVDDSNPVELVEFLGQAYFSAAQGLWSSDGTSAGTTLVADALGGPSWLTVNGATLYFSAGTTAFGREPWKSDGTPAGTQLIKDLNTQAGTFGTLNSYPFRFTVSGGVTYFVAEPVTSSYQLWRTDGTAAGTFIVKQINPGYVATFGDSLFDLAGTLYFLAADGTTTNQELWKSDGTSAGTLLVKDIYPGTSGSYPTAFRNVGGVLLFTASTLSNGRELMRSDGSETGTQLVKDICVGACSGSPQP